MKHVLYYQYSFCLIYVNAQFIILTKKLDHNLIMSTQIHLIEKLKIYSY